MAESALAPNATSVYEPSLFGTYSKKIGMWLFLLSDSLTFGALLYAYSYGRISTPNWPTPFHSASIVNATIMTAFLLTSSLTMVFAVRASADGNAKLQRLFLLATMACGAGFMILHAREWHNLIREGLTLSAFPAVPGQEAAGEFADVAKSVPQFPATFFGLTGMHMLHVTLGVIYLGVIALRRKFIPVLLVCWLVGMACHASLQSLSLRSPHTAGSGHRVLDYFVAETEGVRFLGRGSCRAVLALR